MSTLLAVSVVLDDEGDSGLTARLQLVGQGQESPIDSFAVRPRIVVIRGNRRIDLDHDGSLVAHMRLIANELMEMADSMAVDLDS